MIEAGPWMRAWWYRWAGNSVGKAYIEEMRLVRQGVGISDVSTLGKIDVQGPDAAEFLNRIYVNGFAKLPVGKARYGVMLNDDGIVLDDGTTTRLSETRYFMTTTTAQAGEVMSWVEFLLQAAWPDLKVQVSLAHRRMGRHGGLGPEGARGAGAGLPGPRSFRCRAALYGLRWRSSSTACRCASSASASPASSPMRSMPRPITAWRCGSTSSPRPPRWASSPMGSRRWPRCASRRAMWPASSSITATRWTISASARWRARRSPIVGRELRQRPLLQAPDRWSLVGIECLEPDKRLRGGSILFAAGDKIEGHGRGYITSVTWSIELDKYIALGLYQGGLEACGRGDRLRLSAEGRAGAGAHRLAPFHRSQGRAPPCLSGNRPWPSALRQGRPGRRRRPAPPALGEDARLVPGPGRGLRVDAGRAGAGRQLPLLGGALAGKHRQGRRSGRRRSC